MYTLRQLKRNIVKDSTSLPETKKHFNRLLYLQGGNEYSYSLLSYRGDGGFLQSDFTHNIRLSFLKLSRSLPVGLEQFTSNLLCYGVSRAIKLCFRENNRFAKKYLHTLHTILTDKRNVSQQLVDFFASQHLRVYTMMHPETIDDEIKTKLSRFPRELETVVSTPVLSKMLDVIFSRPIPDSLNVYGLDPVFVYSGHCCEILSQGNGGSCGTPCERNWTLFKKCRATKKGSINSLDKDYKRCVRLLRVPLYMNTGVIAVTNYKHLISSFGPTAYTTTPKPVNYQTMNRKEKRRWKKKVRKKKDKSIPQTTVEATLRNLDKSSEKILRRVIATFVHPLFRHMGKGTRSKKVNKLRNRMDSKTIQDILKKVQFISDTKRRWPQTVLRYLPHYLWVGMAGDSLGQVISSSMAPVAVVCAIGDAVTTLTDKSDKDGGTLTQFAKKGVQLLKNPSLWTAVGYFYTASVPVGSVVGMSYIDQLAVTSLINIGLKVSTITKQIYIKDSDRTIHLMKYIDP